MCAADAIDENYGVAVVFHEEEGGEGGKMETVVAQDEDEGEVRAGRQRCSYSCMNLWTSSDHVLCTA